jgi:hypothetical protein
MTLDLEPGRHALRLLDVADQCSVAPEDSLDIEVAPGDRIPVVFEVLCPATRAWVTVTTTGLSPDRDGYLLAVDEVDSLPLDPFGTAALDLAPGRHTLRLLEVSGACSVVPGATVEMDLPPGRTIQVAFVVSCSTGVSVRVVTTGLDFDQGGYRLEVDGSEREPVLPNVEVRVGLEPGSRTIAVVGLRPNCAFDCSGSRTVTVARAEIVPIEFAVVCTATSGVIGVTVQGSDGGVFEAAVDDTARFPVPQGSGPRYLAGVPAGGHVVSVTAARNCLSETDSRRVTVRTGTLVRDTVEVTFSLSATCVSAGFRIITHTTGDIPRGDYILDICRDPYGGPCPTPHGFFGRVAPNDTVLAQLDQGTYWAALYVPRNSCHVTAQGPPDPIRFQGSGVVNVEFHVTCS